MSELFIDGSKLPYHLDRVVAWQKGEAITPLHIEISPSSACNQRCILCCVDFKGHKPNALSQELLHKLPGELHAAQVKSYLLAGEGEPLLNPHIFSFAHDCHQLGIDGAINSNAMLLDEQATEQLLPYLEWARFTMQSANRERYAAIHGTQPSGYDRVLKNLAFAATFKRTHKLPVTLGMQSILITENQHDIYETCKLARELGLDYYTVKRFCKHPLNTYDVDEDLYKSCEEQFERCLELQTDTFTPLIRWNQFAHQQGKTYSNCLGLPFITQLLADGKLYPCCQFFGDPSMAYGDLQAQSFSEVWHSDHARALIKRIVETFDVTQCMTYCRHHSTNIFLDSLIKKPMHINFI